MEGLRSAENAVRNLLTTDMMVASIMEFLGDEVFGKLQGAAPTEAEIKANAKRIRRRRSMAQRIHAER